MFGAVESQTVGGNVYLYGPSVIVALLATYFAFSHGSLTMIHPGTKLLEMSFNFIECFIFKTKAFQSIIHFKSQPIDVFVILNRISLLLIEDIFHNQIFSFFNIIPVYDA